MSNLRSLPPTAVLILLLAGPSGKAEEQPSFLPTRDVDVVYDVTRPKEPKIRERVRWLADQHLERIDGPDKTATIFDRGANEVTLLTPASRAYRKLEGAPRRALEPSPGVGVKRGKEDVVAGLHCVDWSWTEDFETRTVCATADGVLLRLVVDGQTVIQARSVSYGRQGPELFQIPPDYVPALAPEGAAEP